MMMKILRGFFLVTRSQLLKDLYMLHVQNFNIMSLHKNFFM